MPLYCGNGFSAWPMVPVKFGKGIAMFGNRRLRLCERGRGQGLRQKRSQRKVLGRDLIGERTGDAGARQPVAGARAVGHAEHQVRGKRMLDIEAPVLVVRSFAAEVGVAVGHGLSGVGPGADGRSGRGGDEANAVAGVEERRRQRIARIAAIPVVRGLAGDRC